ncbi:MAG: hypothetical protein K2I28_00740 [Muribaculaceae bacterium]|nr:hypothetical protein [Muribaculaceae bacterium]
MKKFVSAVAMVAIAFISFVSVAQVEYSKDCRKEAQKYAKTQAKEVKKQKWDYAGTVPLAAAFEKYNLKSGDCGLYEAKTITTNNIKYVTQGENSCFKAVCREVAMECNNEVRGIAAGEDTLEGDAGDRMEVDKMAQKYAGQLNGVVSKVITLTRKEANGLYTVRCFYLVDKEKKQKLVSAMAKDMERLSDRASKIVKEVFEED